MGALSGIYFALSIPVKICEVPPTFPQCECPTQCMVLSPPGLLTCQAAAEPPVAVPAPVAVAAAAHHLSPVEGLLAPCRAE